MKKLFSVLLLVLFFVACNKNEVKEEEIIKITVEEFFEKASELTDKKVEISGTIVHTCSHGGKRAHIVGEDPDKKVKLEIVGNTPKFEKEMEGDEVIAEGFVRLLIIDEDYLNKWEADIKVEGESDKNLHAGHDSDHEGMTEQEENLAKIANYRKQLEDTGKKQLEFLSIDCTKHQIKK